MRDGLVLRIKAFRVWTRRGKIPSVEFLYRPIGDHVCLTIRQEGQVTVTDYRVPKDSLRDLAAWVIENDLDEGGS